MIQRSYDVSRRTDFDFDGNLVEGDMPRKQIRLISAWAELHKDELEANWRLVKEHEPLFNIEPLR